MSRAVGAQTAPVADRASEAVGAPSVPAGRRGGRLRPGPPGPPTRCAGTAPTGASPPAGATSGSFLPLPAAAATITGIPDRPGLARRPGRHHEPAAVRDQVRPQLRNLPDPDHGTPGSSRSGRASAAPTAPRPSRPPRSCRPNCSTSSTPAPRRRLGAPAARRLNPDQAGARDRAPLRPVGLVAALRRSELAALTVADVTDHLNGLVLSLPPGPRPTRPANRPNSSSPPVRQPSPAGRPYILRSATSVSPSTWSSYARADRVPVLHAAIPRRRSVTQVPPRFESSTL